MLIIQNKLFRFLILIYLINKFDAVWILYKMWNSICEICIHLIIIRHVNHDKINCFSSLQKGVSYWKHILGKKSIRRLKSNWALKISRRTRRVSLSPFGSRCVSDSYLLLVLSDSMIWMLVSLFTLFFLGFLLQICELVCWIVCWNDLMFVFPILYSDRRS